MLRVLLQFLQRLEVLALFRRQLARQQDVHGGVEVAGLAALAGGRHAVTFQAEPLRVLRRLRNLQPQRFATECLHVGFAAEHRGGERNRHARVKVATLPLELPVRRRANPKVQIAGPCAAGPLFAFARDPDARPLADAGRDPDVDRARLTIVLDGDPARRPVIAVLERQLDLLLDVAAVMRLRRARRAAAAAARARLARRAGASEERLEEIGERVVVAEHLVHLFRRHRPVAALAAGPAAAEMGVPPAAAELTRIEAGAAGARARLFVGAPVGAQLVVLLALGRIAEDFVRLVDLLELGLGRLVAGIHVRMVLARELPEGLFDLFLACRLRDAERGVIILEIHESNPSMRLSWSSSWVRRRFDSRADSASSRISGRSRCTTSAISSSRCTPARLMPPSSTRRLMSFSRSSSSREYNRMLPIVRDGWTRPRRSYFRSVCGCIPSIRAATLMKKSSCSTLMGLLANLAPIQV